MSTISGKISRKSEIVYSEISYFMALRINITFGRTDKVKFKKSLEFLSSILKQSSDVHEIQIFDNIFFICRGKKFAMLLTEFFSIIETASLFCL